MVKVTKGAFSGQRPTGYQFYNTNIGIGSSTTVRRVNPTDARQAIGTSPAQKRQKEVFGLAAKMYASWTIHERDFYTRVRRLSIFPLGLGKVVRKFLIGRELALNDIMSYLNTPKGTFKKPLGFCVYAKDCERNMTTGNTLRITSEKLPDYLYEETNGEGSHFPASSLSPLYDPYHIDIDGRDLGLITAKELHKSRYIGLYDWRHFTHNAISISFLGKWIRIQSFAFIVDQPPSDYLKATMRYHITANLQSPRYATISVTPTLSPGFSMTIDSRKSYDLYKYRTLKVGERIWTYYGSKPPTERLRMSAEVTAEYCWE